MMRALTATVVVVVAAWLGSILAACAARECPPCGPPKFRISGGTFTIARARMLDDSIPALVGGEVVASPERLVIRYRSDGEVHEAVFRVTHD